MASSLRRAKSLDLRRHAGSEFGSFIVSFEPTMADTCQGMVSASAGILIQLNWLWAIGNDLPFEICVKEHIVVFSRP